ncbi:Lid2 complex component [Lachnellula occidentalis]|uniref:Lid2 complex component n=1 Tax=Lachnellula occidentalis TaxID=215460 RepID=A0A8H8S889_9HELO|nr:Lid2 complex component [Lachnellula occidentalis]
MTKDVSGLSSAAGSARGDSNEMEVRQPSDAPLNPPLKSPPPDESNRPINSNALDTGAAISQPMTATNSNASTPSIKDIGSAAPYGTRSRNRTGTSRPNYAEDKELDMEFEAPPTAKDNLARKARATDLNASDVGKPANSSRKGAAPEGDQPATLQIHNKDPIPGTSTFSANPATAAVPTQSKKRKAAAQSTTNQTEQGPSQTTLPVQTVTRRASMAAQVAAGFRETNMLTFENCDGRLKEKKLVADDGTLLEVNDHVYLVCEPPGEPYYLGRIMEFLHISNDNTQPIDALRLNWYYRPKDIGRKVNDTRQVFASMHSDISPLTALRGKCQIKHKSEVDKLDELRKTKDCFWYEKLYDRYIHRFYDVIPTSQVINVPTDVKKVLDERWKFIVVEPGRGKELTSAVKSCKRCNKYCASNDSVDCAVCHNTYHMSCVNPPLLKKPSRGFAWACGPCSKAQEKKLEARNTPNVTDTTMEAEDEEFNEEEEDSAGVTGEALDTVRTSPSTGANVSVKPGTTEQIHQTSLWLFRYLGMHCKVEDALDYDDRIYPRASSRLGPRHQANVPMWPGRPVEYVKPAEIKKKYMKGSGHKKDAKLSKETVAALEADKIKREKRPKWVMDEPPGYVHRGEDCDNDDPNNTAKLLYKLPEPGQLSFTLPKDDDGHYERPDDNEQSERERFVFEYLCHAKDKANPVYHLPEMSTNVLDVALQTLQSNGYDIEKALRAMINHDKGVFKEPELSATELKKFEDGVSKFGSEWHSIKKHVKTVSAANIVRFYYTWKKTERGKHIWGNYSGRKGKKEAKRAEATSGKLQDDVADEYDDSAFDNDKAFEKKRGFQCKFCGTRSCRQWRRAPNTPAGTMIIEPSATKPSGKDKGTQLMVALCQRCAELWRRYAVQWEDVDEMAKKVAQAGGRAWKRKIDEELLKELVAANETLNHPANITPVAPTSAGGTPAPAASNPPSGVEPPRKKVKAVSDKDSNDPALESGAVVTSGQKKKVVPEKPVPPPIPEPPKPKLLPCAICGEMEPMGDQHVSCKECRLTVHRNCYGIMGESRTPNKWVCDMCSNDKNPQVSIQYKCVLCPVEYTEHDFVEPPKISHKKKTEKERERDRLERESAQKDADFFRKKQEELNKPVNPREPLKRTANNNWVHVTCAVFTPEVKFGNAKALEPSEGIPSIASARYDEACKACKKKGVHVECAHQGGYILGFDIAPVKGSRRDQFNIVNINGEVGTMVAAIWCKEHGPTKTIVHQMNDIVDENGCNALQLYVQNFKQADLTLTGTVRKATLVNQSTKVVNPLPVTQTPNRRTSTATGANGHSTPARGSVSHPRVEELDVLSTNTVTAEKICATCGIDVSPKWWSFPPVAAGEAASNSDLQTNGDHSFSNGSLPNEGQALLGSIGEDDGSHAALAAAALHQNTQVAPPEPTEFQCHQCHWKKVQKKPSPPPAVIQQETSGAPISAPPTTNAPIPDPDAVQERPHYAWPAPPSYPSNGSYNNWSRHSPASQAATPVNQLNGNHSPATTSAALQPLNGQAQVRQSSYNQPQSPHQNGHIGQVTNGYPPSPHRSMGSSTLHMQNGTYASYASTRPTPQHLTNGGPPPRAPEHPFSNAPMRPRSSIGPPQGSPPMHHEAHPPSREPPQPSNARQNDGRVNGGASASPSLRNLLS